jgi:hypothetical protein
MVLPLAAILPIAGATLGAIGGYKESGGNIGAAALSSGLGALSMGGLSAPLQALGGRMAGTALGAKLAPEAYKVAEAGKALAGLKGIAGAKQAFATAGMANPMVQQMAGSNVLAKTLAGLGAAGAALTIPAVAANLTAKAAGPGRDVAGKGAQAALGALGYRAPGEVDYDAMMSGAVPDVGTFGAGGTLSNPLSVYGPTGMAQRAEMLKTAEAQRDAIRLLSPEIAKASEFAKKQEFQRALAAAGVRQNIVTAANMLERSQQAAQQMGLNAASQIGSALTSQYQYQ